jgi:hypothetical protein
MQEVQSTQQVQVVDGEVMSVAQECNGVYFQHGSAAAAAAATAAALCGLPTGCVVARYIPMSSMLVLMGAGISRAMLQCSSCAYQVDPNLGVQLLHALCELCTVIEWGVWHDAAMKLHGGML